ncbi:MAG: phospholipase D-like domain-containing protein [Anaerolineae bacterium]
MTWRRRRRGLFLPGLAFVLALLAAGHGSAGSPPPVILEEIAWMGTTASPFHEWMELRNTTDAPIPLDGWTLVADDGSPSIALSGVLPPQGHFLLERGSDDTVPGVTADLIYTGALENEGEALTLSSPGGNPVDRVDAWHAGRNATKQTMQRYAADLPGTDPAAWVDGPAGGTPQNTAGWTWPAEPLAFALFFTDSITATAPSPMPTPMEQALLALLNGAQDSVHAALYALDRASIRDALLAAHGRGVEVQVVADDDAYADDQYYPHFRALEQAGIPLVLDRRSSLMHNKFLVVDGQTVWTGSTNMTDSCFTYNHNNSVAIASTQVAYAYNLEFHEMFALGRFGRAKADNTPHWFGGEEAPLEVYFAPTDGVEAQILEEVSHADQTIAFATFFFTSEALADALIHKAEQGVSVRGLWDRLGAANASSQDERLCAAGIPVKVEDFGGKLHHKFLVVDPEGEDPTVITGSVNWSASGTDQNDENLVILHDAATAQRYYAEWAKLWNALGGHTLCWPTGVPSLFLPLVEASWGPGE